MKRARTITVLLIAAGACGSALGQDALGDGRALDNSLSTQSRYNARRPSLADEFRFRNAIVTGNAPNGMSFRGDVGYTAPGEFSGLLGSNDLYAFRRDSLNSGLAGMGIRGAEALQMQFAMTTGARPPQNLMGTYSVPRSGGSTLAPITFNDPLHPEQAIQRAPELDETEGAGLTSLRAPSSFDANRGYQPMLLAWETPQEGQDWYGITASELRGVSRSELSLPENPAGRLDNAVAPELIENSYIKLMERLQLESQMLPPPVVPEDEVDQNKSSWQIRLEQLQRDYLLDLSAPKPIEPAPEGAGPSGAPPLPGQPAEGQLDPQTVDLLRSYGPPAKDFVAPDVNDVYGEHMRIGQKYFQEGRYFDAEERFAQALTIRPNDVVAQTARIHAQIGGGMYLSAALNLRTLILEQPPVVSARYDASLLPDAERLAEVVAALREGIAGAQGREVNGAMLRRARASGLLLAYIGFQTSDHEMTGEGIEAARAAIVQSTDPASDGDNKAEQRLLNLLDAVWGDRQAP